MKNIPEYRLGDYTDRSYRFKSNRIHTQGIDRFSLDDKHASKIEVHGTDCKEIAELIVRFLNTYKEIQDEKNGS